MVKDLGHDGYKYLGVPEADNIKRKELKELVSKKFLTGIKTHCKHLTEKQINDEKQNITPKNKYSKTVLSTKL